MKAIIILTLLMTVNLTAQEGGIGTPPPPPADLTKVGNSISWTHDFQDINNQPLVPDGYMMFYAPTIAELGTAAEKEIAFIDPSVYQDTTNQNLFIYKASMNPLLNGQKVCLEMTAYAVISGTRYDSTRSPATCLTIMVKPSAPKTIIAK